MHFDKQHQPCCWQFDPEASIVERDTGNVPLDYLPKESGGTGRFPLPDARLMWIQRGGSHISRDNRCKKLQDGTPTGAIVFWPIKGSGAIKEDIVIPVECPYDTVHVQGLDMECATPVILDIFSKFGAIVAASRSQKMDNPNRQFMCIQYLTWKSAWETIVYFHGRNAGRQDLNVHFSYKCLSVVLESSRVGDTIWELI